MKLENCGRCGLQAVNPWKENENKVGCPACGDDGNSAENWNADQFMYRTDRINAAAVALMAGGATVAY